MLESCTSGPTVDETLTPSQCKQLIPFLSSQFQLGYGNTSDLQQQEAFVSCFSGILSAYSAFPSKTNASWVLDTGATHHICCALNLFHFYIPTTSIVTLPNNSDVPATRVGTVHLSSEFILENVLYVLNSISTLFMSVP